MGKKMNRATIKKLYREAILQVFRCDDEELDAPLLAAVKKDIHLGDSAPGQWSPGSVLEIYCENGIPNATDVHDFSYEAREFGIDLKSTISYNSDKWTDVDDVVNLMLEVTHPGTKVHHEPYNNAVVNVYWS